MLATATPPEISWRELPLADGLDEAAESYPETRIGAFDFSEATRTEVLGYASGSAHRASIDSCPEVVADLGFYSQPDPIGLAGGPNPFTYADGRPLNFSDPLGLYHLGDVIYRCGPKSCDVAFVWADPTPESDGNGDETILTFGPANRCPSEECHSLPEAHFATPGGELDPWQGMTELGYWRSDRPDSRATYQSRLDSWDPKEKWLPTDFIPREFGQCYNFINHMTGLSQTVGDWEGFMAGEFGNVRGIGWWRAHATHPPKR